jgi:superoxide dismutase, Fe-Mn family
MNTNRSTRRQVLGAGVAGVAVAALGTTARAQDDKAPAAAAAKSDPGYVARNYEGLVGMPGFNEALLRNHFKLYEGYVKNVNAVTAEIDAATKAGKGGAPSTAELRRRLGWEWNGMRLHEIYFENLGGKKPLAADAPLAKALAAQWGSVDAWLADFRATAGMRGIGWAALVKDGWNGRLFNIWIDEHDGGHFGACPILLLMDVFEHAYLVDNASRKADYVDAFLKNVEWDVVGARLG